MMLLIKKIQALIGLGKVLLSKQNEAQIELLKGEIQSLPRFKEYGFESFPSQGKALAICPSGNKSDGLIIKIEQSGTPSLEKSEVALWSESGAILKLKSDGTIEATGNLKIDGDLNVQGKIEATGDVVAGGISLQNHTHPFTNADGVPSTTDPAQ